MEGIFLWLHICWAHNKIIIGFSADVMCIVLLLKLIDQW